ncbi:MAG: thioredoxin family protein [Sulfurovum sp.]|nr:thioredoxin family protein [Sulfurovum sp.]
MLLETPICDFGWKAPNFELKDTQGNAHTLASFIGKDSLYTKGLLVAFICNHCPYVIAIIERLVADAKVLQKQGIAVVAIMPNDFNVYTDDNPENMALFAKEHGFTFPYLVDADQSVAKAYGAVCTPDFFGFNAKGELQYRGRLDDAKMEHKTNIQKELLSAMLQVAHTGEGPKEQIASMGCSIKWNPRD